MRSISAHCMHISRALKMPWQKTLCVCSPLHHVYSLVRRLTTDSTLPQNGKGLHLVTSQVVRECQEGLSKVDVGIFMLHCMHTSAGLTVSLFGSLRS